MHIYVFKDTEMFDCFDKFTFLHFIKLCIFKMRSILLFNYLNDVSTLLFIIINDLLYL